MKLLVVALLLANAAVFGWQYTVSVRNATRAIVERPPPLPTDTPSLVLLRELETLPKEKSPAEPVQIPEPVESEVKADVAAGDQCIDIGPYAEAAARDALGEWMQDFVASSHTRSVTVRGGQFFWIYLEPSSTSESARENLAGLAEKGVQDYMLISRGDLKNAISLGLFRSQDSVNRRLAELSDKGYKPVVVPRYEETQAYYIALQLALSADGRPDIPASLLGEAKVTELDCSELPGQAAAAAPLEGPPAPLVEGLTD